MRAVVQRVGSSCVVTDTARTVGAIDDGLLVYLGVLEDDTDGDARYLADKIRYLRIFPDDDDHMNRDIVQSGGSILLVSAFTTAADARRGRRPSFDRTAKPGTAEPLYQLVCELLSDAGLRVQTGCFGAMMQVASTNLGPVCILLDSKRAF